MDKELKRQLFCDVLKQVKFLGEKEIGLIATELLAVDDITKEEETQIVEDNKVKEIQELEAKKAEAEKVIAETTEKLQLLIKPIR